MIVLKDASNLKCDDKKWISQDPVDWRVDLAEWERASFKGAQCGAVRSSEAK